MQYEYNHIRKLTEKLNLRLGKKFGLTNPKNRFFQTNC